MATAMVLIADDPERRENGRWRRGTGAISTDRNSESGWRQRSYCKQMGDAKTDAGSVAVCRLVLMTNPSLARGRSDSKSAALCSTTYPNLQTLSSAAQQHSTMRLRAQCWLVAHSAIQSARIVMPSVVPRYDDRRSVASTCSQTRICVPQAQPANDPSLLDLAG